jgi:hypothetical protein
LTSNYEADNGATLNWHVGGNLLDLSQSGINPVFVLSNINTYAQDAIINPSSITSTPTATITLTITGGSNAGTYTKSVTLPKGIFIGNESTNTDISALIGDVSPKILTPSTYISPPNDAITEAIVERKIYVNGNLRFNRAYGFENGSGGGDTQNGALKLLFGQLSSAEVLPRTNTASVPFNLRLSRVRLQRSCSDCMWLGIKNRGRVSLTRQTVVAGAHRAIEILPVASNQWLPQLSLANSRLNSNYAAITAINANFDLLRYNRITVNGGSFQHANGCTPHTFTNQNFGNWSRYGFEVADIPVLDFEAAQNPTSPGKNWFRNLSTGIRAIHVNLTTRNCQYRNIGDFGYSGDEAGTAIYFFNRTQSTDMKVWGQLSNISTYTSEDFVFCKDCIKAASVSDLSSNSTILLDGVSSVSSHRWLSVNSFGSWAPGEFVSIVMANNIIYSTPVPEFHAYDIPAPANLPFGHPHFYVLNIVDNHPLEGVFYAVGNLFGIENYVPSQYVYADNMTAVVLTSLTQPSVGSSNTFELDQNRLPCFNCRTAVFAQNLSKSTFSSNIFYSGSSLQNYTSVGLRLIGGDHNIVTCNTFRNSWFDASPQTSLNGETGLYVQGSTNTGITMNLFWGALVGSSQTHPGLDVGIRLAGTLIPNFDMAYNDFLGTMWTSVYHETGNIFGTQANRGNEWKIVPNDPAFSFVALGPDDVMSLLPSLGGLYIVPQAGSICTEQANVEFSNVDNNTIGVCVNDKVCEGTNGSSNLTEPTPSNQLNNMTVLNGNLPEGSLWSATLRSVEFGIPVLFAPDSLLNFAVVVESSRSELIEAHGVDAHVEEAKVQSDNLRTLLAELALFKKQAFADDSLSINEASEIMMMRLQILSLQDSVHEGLQAYQESALDKSESIHNELSILLGSEIEPGVLSALSQTWLNLYWRRDFELLATQTDLIELAAQLCADQYGQSVYEIRALYTVLTGKFADETCIGEVGLIKQKVAPKQIPQWMLLPNPASQYMRIEHNSNELCGISILTIVGTEVKHIERHKSGKIDISDLMPGTYVVQVRFSNLVESRLLIVHD